MVDDFLKIEEKYDLFNEKIGDFYFWHFIRFGIYREIERKVGYIDAVVYQKKKRKALLILKKVLYSALGGYKKKTDVFITCVINHKTKNDKFSNIYVEQLTKSLKNSFVVMEQKTTYFRKNEYGLDNVYSNLDLDIYIKLYKMTSKVMPLIAFSKNFENAISAINDKYSCDITQDQLHKIVITHYIRWKAGRKYFKRVLKKIKPKVILEVCSYGIDNMIINELAKELKIPTIEFQHGIMGEGHLAYNFSKKQNLPAFPDYIFTYSDFWNHTTRFPIPDEKVIATGFPHLEEITKKSNNPNVKTDKNNNRKNILFISQWATANKLSEFAVDLYDYLSEHYKGEFSITYKMHPSDNIQNMECFEKLSQYSDKIEIVTHSEKTLYDCFFDADVQVGAFSTGVYEGLAFGLKTYLLKVNGSERMQALVDKGYAKYVNYPKDVDIGQGNDKNFESNDFWKENALDNILENIDIIMKEG